MPNQTERRKVDHIKICLTKDVQFRKSNGFERFEFVHNALPDVNFDDIDTSVMFLGKKFMYPLYIEAMVGGTKVAGRINRNLAMAAEKLGIGMGVGSQRAMIENPSLAETYQVRDVAPNIFLAGNIGAAQLLEYEASQIIEAAEKIEADAIAVHLNAAQEIVQPEGDDKWHGVYDKIADLCKSSKIPVIAKEVGNGISGEVAKRLVKAGIKAIDVAGAGGTSWVKVECMRGGFFKDDLMEWGIPTAYALQSCIKSVRVPLIASGGMYSGLDAAKAMAMGATLVGIARPLLKLAVKGHKDVSDFLLNMADTIKRIMFLLNSKNIDDLRRAGVVESKV